MIDVIRFKPGHLDLIAIKTAFSGDPTIKDRTICLCEGSIAHTFIKDERVIAIIGGHLLWPGVADLWSITSPLVSQSPVEFHKKVLEVLGFYQRKYDLVRAQATVRESFTQGHDWIQSLGFELEAKLHRYGPEGDDYSLYARLF